MLRSNSAIQKHNSFLMINKFEKKIQSYECNILHTFFKVLIFFLKSTHVLTGC